VVKQVSENENSRIVGERASRQTRITRVAREGFEMGDTFRSRTGYTYALTAIYHTSATFAINPHLPDPSTLNITWQHLADLLANREWQLV
jgi:hypothetical protein